MTRILQNLYGLPSRPTNEIENALKSYQPNVSDYPDDFFGQLSCILAYEAVLEGNFGIGCVLVDSSQNVVVQGHNELFNPYFRSDRHGEMVVMDTFEENNKSITSMADYTLFTSLESCPMCLARLITSGVGTVKYLSPDLTGGMVHLMTNLPPIWQELAARQQFPQADVSPTLIELAFDIFMVNADALNSKIVNR
jgi:tRNA(Arg) A34 adenosine deaminase TadA